METAPEEAEQVKEILSHEMRAGGGAFRGSGSGYEGREELVRGALRDVKTDGLRKKLSTHNLRLWVDSFSVFVEMPATMYNVVTQRLL